MLYLSISSVYVCRVINTYLNTTARANGCSARVAMVASEFNKHIQSERFKKTHVDIATKVGALNRVLALTSYV